jgi:dihydrodipicolinate synthase/N-acetylneuraminate lyase
MLTLPFQFIGSLFSSVTSFIGTSITWFGDSNHGVIGFITAVFGFMPPEVRTIISGLLSFIAIFSIYKLIRR